MYEEWLFRKKKREEDIITDVLPEEEIPSHINNFYKLRKLLRFKKELSNSTVDILQKDKIWDDILDIQLKFLKELVILHSVKDNGDVAKLDLRKNLNDIALYTSRWYFGKNCESIPIFSEIVAYINYLYHEYYDDDVVLYFYDNGEEYEIRDKVEDKKKSEKHKEDDPFQEEKW